MNKIIFKGGTIIDGSGNKPYEADVVIEDGRIKSIGSFPESSDYNVISISGLVLSPGFIDIHSHSDYYLVIDSLAKGKLMQGVTTEIGGNCGYSAAPIYGIALEDRRKGYKEQFGIDHEWDSVSSYLKNLSDIGISINYGHLVGSNTVRSSVMGYDNRAPEKEELMKMVSLVKEGIKEGALGLSFGLAYAPSCYAKKAELVALASAAYESNGIITAHIRSESRGLVEAITEIIEVAKESKASLQISHLKTMGKDNWKKLDEVFLLIEKAQKEGVSISCDRYPYLAANTGLQAVLPDHVLAGGRGEALKRIAEPVTRNDIWQEITELHPDEEYWQNIMISQVVSEKNKDIEGKRASEGALLRDKKMKDFIFDLLIEEEMNVDAIFFSMDENNFTRIIQKKYTMIGSDAGARSIDGPLSKGYPHPRSFGTFPKILGEYVREKKIISLEEAIYKMTFAPCERLGIKDRGLIKENFFADITVFDPKKVSDNSSYNDPKRYPSGIEYVVVNGDIVIEKGEHSGKKPGQVITKKTS